MLYSSNWYKILTDIYLYIYRREVIYIIYIYRQIYIVDEDIQAELSQCIYSLKFYYIIKFLSLSLPFINKF